METKKFYYDSETKIIEVTPFDDDLVEQDKPFIELTYEEWSSKLSACEYGKKKAYINNEIVEIDDVELQATEEYKQMKLEEEKLSLQNYLLNTDYIINKLNELKLEDDSSYETEKLKYANDLAKRREARNRINEIETLLK